MRHLYTAFAAALIASSAATAQTAATRNVRLTPNKQAIALAKKSNFRPAVKLGSTAASGKRFNVASTTGTTTTAPIIDAQPEGKLHANFYFSGESFVNMMGYEAQLPFDGIWGKIVEAPDNKTIYINNPIGAYYSDAWIKGERTTGDTIEVKLPQQFVHEEYDGMSTDAWLYKLVPVKVEQDGETYTTFKPDSTSQTVKYVWRNDSIVLVNTTQDSKLLGMCTEAGEWYGYGDYIQQYTVFDQQPVAPKDETKATQMSITYYDSGQMYGRVKKVVREGNDIYIAGLNGNIPSGWAKGTISGNKATFSGHQYMGLDTVTASYAFFEPVSHNMVWDSEIGDSIESLTLADAITFDYDADKGTLSTDSTFVANQGYKMFNQVFTYDGATLEPWTEKAATPLAVDASTMSYMPFSEEYGYGLLAFAPSEFDADGYILDANKLYYSIYLDDDVLTINPDEYKLFPYETTEIPFIYSDMLDFVNYAGLWQVYTFVTGIDRIGVQMIYKGGGEVRKSAITYISATDEDPSAVSNVAQTGKVAGVTYTDLSGRRVSRPGKGLFIQTTRLADGTITTSKRLFK
ncbi:hypothetical protein [Prevotellamassilia timonensis]|uniref:hypothetical protein n=1 Tax=Prevotellamassilia timonensis TaxID=1852370 RepID=UPI00307F7BCC